jgi:hypothetical protein
MAKGGLNGGKMRGILTKVTNVGLIALGFFAVFFTSHSKSSAPNGGSHEDVYGTKIAHADIPVSSGGSVSDGGGSGSGGCSGGDGGGSGSAGGDGGGGSGCGCGCGG